MYSLVKVISWHVQCNIYIYIYLSISISMCSLDKPNLKIITDMCKLQEEQIVLLLSS